MSWTLVEEICLGIAAFLFFGTAAIGFKFVSSPYLLGYILAGAGFFCLSLLAARLGA
ncbi:MAG: hypothetical protein M3179_08055 [Actinomycetota bacterium]|nr:hypothetical protein [Actinomycetota bacterium]